MMKHGSLFSGIGGFDLASEWMGWENVFHCEWNEFGRTQNHLMTLQKPILQNMQTKLIFSREDSHVNPTQWRENDKAKKMNATYGLRCLEQYERFPRVSSWAKMFAASLIGMEGWYSRRCALSWKVMGIKSRPLLYLRARSVRHIEGIEYGSSLPTPNAMDWNTAAKRETYEARKERHAKNGVNLQMTLRQMAKLQMLPTPTCQDAKQKENSPSQQHKINQLSICVAGGSNSQLNPQFVGEMMGFPPNWTELPFQSGEQNQLKHTETR
jgi:hypothetical protein